MSFKDIFQPMPKGWPFDPPAGQTTYAKEKKRIEERRRRLEEYGKRGVCFIEGTPLDYLCEEAWLEELRLSETESAKAVFIAHADSNLKRVPRIDRNNSAN
jgi:hypothetical protein